MMDIFTSKFLMLVLSLFVGKGTGESLFEVRKECRDDVDCLVGICDVENTPNYLDCEYCEDGHCVRGCIDDTMCPDEYKCTGHFCSANDGKALLKNIKVYSAYCFDCSTEGLELTLNGRQDVVNKVQCRTNTLDHYWVDYDGGVAVFDDIQTLGYYTPDGGCLNAPLDGAVTESEWKWTGTGTWAGASICVEWQGGDVYATICQIIGGNTEGKITDCEKIGSPYCP